MAVYNIKYSNPSIKQLKKIKEKGLINNVEKLINIIKQNPYQNPPSFEKLIGFDSVYSRRINIKHRLIYKIDNNKKIIYILSLWSHYENGGI